MSEAIKYYPNPVLLKKADPVEEFDASLETIINQMTKAMYDAGGIGLAAPQIGIPLQIFVMDLDRSGESPEVFINPVLEVLNEEKVFEHEGCLSLPGAGCQVPRYKEVRLKALDKHGKGFEVVATGLKSACFQHECDHLNGHLYITHLSSLKRRRMISDFRKHKKA